MIKQWKNLLIYGLVVIASLMPATGQAGTKEDFDEAEKLLIAASASIAAYSDRAGKLAFEYLEESGWDAKPYEQTNSRVETNFLAARKKQTEGHPVYLLALTGTETLKDVKTDLRFDKVYFAGRTPEEMAENIKLEKPSNELPKVHRGFYQYTHAGLTAKVPETSLTTAEYLSRALLQDEESKVYIVGHSLGGAAATLGGAALINMGVKPEQIEVITFGAPAVGNRAFKQQYEPVLNVKRVVIDGDPVTGILQTVAGGYEQFGQEVRWETSGAARKSPHTMVEYLDLAIKNYYRTRNKAQLTGELEQPTITKPGNRKNLAYIAPLAINLPEPLAAEAWYMQQAVSDQYRKALPQYIMARESESMTTAWEKAVSEDCKWFITHELSGYRLKDKPDEYYITLSQAIRSVATGEIVYMSSHSSGTNRLTPLEALLHAARNMEANMESWVSQN